MSIDLSITVRFVRGGEYAAVEFEQYGATLDMGLLNAEGRAALIAAMAEASAQLSRGLPVNEGEQRT